MSPGLPSHAAADAARLPPAPGAGATIGGPP
jgi:hypothetical protein